jgi:ABC-2 type transport system ATP-binding protein
VVAAQTQDELRARLAGARRVIVELAAAELPRATELFRSLSGVAAVAPVGETRLALTPASGAPDDDGPLREAVFRAAVAAGLVLRELRLEAASLEDLFARATSATGERSA